MIYISFIIPCFNSSEYMRHCIDTILCCKDDVEILIVDDGSNKDNTLEIAKEYENKYNGICRAIHKENGGHGDALNVGIENANGVFIKVVDSDDWVDEEVLKKLVNVVKENYNANKNVDLYITNFIYDKVGQTNKKIMKYDDNIPANQIIKFSDMKKFKLGHYLLMHSLCYSKNVLIKSNLNLPKKTYYVDNIYAYKPLQYVSDVYYLNENLYHYFIGRNDQSVNQEVMIKRLSQQYLVTEIMLYDVDVMSVKDLVLRQYMINYMSIVMTITSIMSILSGDKYWLDKKNELWNELKNKNYPLYRKLRFCLLGIVMNFKTRLGRFVAKVSYKIANKIYGFN